jgi:hypothetical protein
MEYGRIRNSTKQIYELDTFEGVDFAKAPSNVEVYRSPDAVNMTRDEVGKVSKRMGYFNVFTYTDPIYGIFKLGNDFIVHSGKNLYKEVYDNVEEEYTRTELYSDMNEHHSVAEQFNSKLYILDGNTFLVTDGTTCTPVTQSATVPLIKIAGTPSGGGVILQEVNLLSNAWREKFAGNGTDTTFQLSFDNLDSTPLIVKIASISGGAVVWTTKTEGTDYTVNRTNGTVTFTNVPSGPVVGQEDNIDIQASKDRSELSNRINGCTIMIKFGLNGQENQLFVSGNPNYKNIDWWCQVNDPNYYGDLSYSTLGQDDSAIISYSKLGTDLATHKDNKSGKIYIRSGLLDNNSNIIYPVKEVIDGSGCICKYCSENIGEPLFVTELGVQTITIQDYTLKQYEQVRGDRINSKLLKEPNLDKAVACIWKDLYLVSVNGHVYTLDRLQKYYEKNLPYSTFQYAGQYWTNIDAISWYVDGDDLYFGTTEGKIMKFYNDPDNSGSYNDDGEPIDAYWTLPEFSGDVFFRNKNVKFIAVKLKASKQTGIQMYAQIDGQWELIFEDFTSFGYADFNYFDFEYFTFSTDTTPRKAQSKITVRKKDKSSFRLRNNIVNQPFGIYSVAFIYTEKGINKD